MSYGPELEELFAHIRAWHRYEPEDWLGWDWDSLPEKKKFTEYQKTHSEEHRLHESFWEEWEWTLIKHPIGSRDADPPESVFEVEMLDPDGERPSRVDDDV